MSSPHKKKVSIKVIKKRSRASVPAVLVVPTEPVAPLQSVPEIDVPDDSGEMATTIKRWIGERRENRRVESDFSDTQLATWKLAPDTSR